MLQPFGWFQLRVMSNHGSIPFSTWHQWQRGIHWPCLLESSPWGKTGVSVRALLTGIQSGLYIKARSCQCCEVEKTRFLISRILCPSPKKLCSCFLAGNPSLGKRVTDPLWWWAPTGTAGRLLLFIVLHSCGSGPMSKMGEGFSLREREDSCRVNCFRLWISGLWEVRDLRSNLCFSETS